MSDDVRVDIVEYLKTKGWNVIMIAEHGVQKQTAIPYRYEYVMSFLGKHPDYDSLNGTKIRED